MTVGVALHAAIMVTVAVGFFSPAMFVLYLAFLSPETVRMLRETLNAFLRTQGKRRRRPASADETWDTTATKPVGHDALST